ncbi:DNA-repair protein rad13 [Verticillium alfalfae VaMs.102]|uniref:DNA-repair protein rad13 n=1 Tax=Verticillium alfalfae (strain VaMs.102 / ATCC MYA-4576 / FGSC 10136) TaxID=526221 RepID=C9SH50_VERA1|nr:DNA-repair protein rad13 [Verticillium alfalfae VaMs.102]EEY17644.1 DNA-repair protein rad13 [Verticillium alfalfae VaMs.102]
MGVNGLWTVLQPCARPTNLATLNRKRLAVDASIWIYQFLKAVRDKEGNALRNSHVVGFFRRICKLLWFGIRPVFVFDGGAPALKRQTIQGRKRRREGRRDDAVRTAGKLLAVQMQRIAEEQDEKRKRELERGVDERARQAEMAEEEAVPNADQLVYVGEVGMSQQERQQTRTFRKQDQYHLPKLDGDISSMARADDPRIMSVEELEEYARQFNNGEDLNLYDFSKIDFNGEFFKSLPPPDRYNILNAARLRSRLRMGLSKEQLEEMFPNRMDFSRFQIERVKERNNLTQLLMKEVGMTGLDLTINGGGRIAGERDREYILVKNDGVEGGWALGVVSKEKDIGEAHKPIDIDALEFKYQQKDEEPEMEEEEEFEDVPVQGLNRLPKLSHGTEGQTMDEDDSLFVGGDKALKLSTKPQEQNSEDLHPEEEDDINQAIALSLQSQHVANSDTPEVEDVFEDVELVVPQWEQKAVPQNKPIASSSGRMVAHIVNNRASAAVPKRRQSNASSSDSDNDLQAALAASRKNRKAQPKAVPGNIKNPFGGPLPFPKLDIGTAFESDVRGGDEPLMGDLDDMAGGFRSQKPDPNAPKPLPPWMTDNTDIRDTMLKAKEVEQEINAEDREAAAEEEMMFQRKRQNETIEIASSDDGSDVEVLEVAPAPKKMASPAEISSTPSSLAQESSEKAEVTETQTVPGGNSSGAPSADEANEPVPTITLGGVAISSKSSVSPEPEFEDIEIPEQEDEHDVTVRELSNTPESVVPVADISTADKEPDTTGVAHQADFEEALAQTAQPADENAEDNYNPFGDSDVDEYSDPEDEELFASLAQEADEHARFASELNHKSEQENREAYERELKALRTQQKKDRRDADEVTQVMVGECQALLRLFGIPYITAPMEAEAQCAELVRLGLVDGIVTDDSDTFLFGGTRVYKNMFNSNKLVECYLSSDLDKELSLSREQLVSIALLLGSDYTDGLPGVGPVTAVEILSEFPESEGGLAAFCHWWADVQGQRRPKEDDAPNAFRRKFRKSQVAKLFLPVGFPNPAVREAYMKPEVDDSPETFQWGVPNLEGLRQYLMATIGWSEERTDEVLVPVIRDMNRRDVEGTQSNITRYFEGGVGTGAKESFAPRQKQKASKRMAEAVNKLRNTGASVSESSPTTDTPTASSGSKRKRTARAATRTSLVDEEPGTGEDDDEAEAAVPRTRGRGKRTKADR